MELICARRDAVLTDGDARLKASSLGPTACLDGTRALRLLVATTPFCIHGTALPLYGAAENVWRALPLIVVPSALGRTFVVVFSAAEHV